MVSDGFSAVLETAKAQGGLEILTVRQLATRVRVSERRIRRWKDRGRLQFFKVRNRIFFIWGEIMTQLPWHLIARAEKVPSDVARLLGF